jgi:hypothetical protein
MDKDTITRFLVMINEDVQDPPIKDADPEDMQDYLKYIKRQQIKGEEALKFLDWVKQEYKIPADTKWTEVKKQLASMKKPKEVSKHIKSLAVGKEEMAWHEARNRYGPNSPEAKEAYKEWNQKLEDDLRSRFGNSWKRWRAEDFKKHGELEHLRKKDIGQQYYDEPEFPSEAKPKPPESEPEHKAPETPKVTATRRTVTDKPYIEPPHRERQPSTSFTNAFAEAAKKQREKEEREKKEHEENVKKFAQEKSEREAKERKELEKRRSAERRAAAAKEKEREAERRRRRERGY